MNLAELLTGADLVLRVLVARLEVILALLLTAGIFAWAMWQQTILGAIIAGVWGLSIFLPVLWHGKGRPNATLSGPTEHPEGTAR